MTCGEFQERWDRGDRSPEVAAHMTSCDECRSLLAVDDRVRAWNPPVPAAGEREFLEALRAKMDARPAAPRLRGPRPAAGGPAPWLRFAAAAVILAAMGAAYLLGRATRPVEGPKPGPVAGGGKAPELPAPPVKDDEPKPPAVPPGPGPVKPEPRQKPEFRDRLVAAASGTGREAFLEQVKGGVDRARWIAAFRSPDAEERGAAVTIASVLKDAALAPQLAAAAAKGDAKAIALLGEIGSVESVVALAGLAGAPDRREAVVAALGATGLPEAGEALAAMGAWNAEAAWRKLGSNAAPALVTRLRAGGSRALPALKAAGWARASGTVPELARLLAKEETHEAAATALAAIGGREANEALAAAADPDDEAVMAAVKTQEGRGAVEARMLDVRLAAADRTRAARVVMALGDPLSVPALIRALESPDLRDLAMIALATLKAEESVPAICALLPQRRHRSVAAVALGTIGSPKALPALTAASRERSFYSEATRAIARIGAPESVPHLVAAVGDREAGDAAIEALGRIKDERAVPALIAALQGPNAARAHRALKDVTGQDLPARPADWVRWWKAKNKGTKYLFPFW